MGRSDLGEGGLQQWPRPCQRQPFCPERRHPNHFSRQWRKIPCPLQSSSRRGDEFTFPLLGNCLDIGEQRKKSLHRYICRYMDISFFLWLSCSGICGHKFLFFLWIPCSGIYGHNFLFFLFLVQVQEYQLHVHVCGFAPGADSCRF